MGWNHQLVIYVFLGFWFLTWKKWIFFSQHDLPFKLLHFQLFFIQNTQCWRPALDFWGVNLMYPPPSNSHHQDYYIFRIGNPNLNLHLWLASWAGEQPKVYTGFNAWDATLNPSLPEKKKNKTMENGGHGWWKKQNDPWKSCNPKDPKDPPMEGWTNLYDAGIRSSKLPGLWGSNDP